MNIYELSRSFWDFSFENPDKVRPNHIALYFFSIEHCNRLGWKKKFGLPTSMAMEAVGIKSYNTYIAAFKDLVDWGFFNLVQKSKNQYSSNVIELSKNDNANYKALDKALIKNGTKQIESTEQSTDSINKQIYNIPINNNKSFGADANKDLESYKGFLSKCIKEKEISRDQLFAKHKINVFNKNELWEDFIKNSVVNVPLIEDEKHAWNLFKKFIQDNEKKYQNNGKAYFKGF